MGTLQDYIDQVQTRIHDTNGGDFTQSTLINFINQARKRVALDTHCVRGFLSVTGGSALNTIPQQENYSYSGGGIGGVTITIPGFGYAAPPAVNFLSPTGAGARAEAILGDNGSISEINMTNWGQGYDPADTIVDVADPGVGGQSCQGNASVLTNILDILGVTVLWGNERVSFGYLPFTAFQAYLRQIANQYSVPSVFTLHQGIQQAFLFQVPDQAYPMEWDIITIPTPMTDPAATDLQIIAPWDDAVALYACHLCYASLQNQSMADWYYSGKPTQPGKYDSRIKELPATAFVRRIINPYRTYAKMIKRL